MTESLESLLYQNTNLKKIMIGFTKYLLLIFIFTFTGTVFSHHSFSHFDEEYTEMEGTLVELRWKNPHIFFFVETQEPNGDLKTWEMETGTIYMVGRAGVSEDLFTEGEKIRVAGHTSRLYSDKFHLKNVLLASGEEIITVATSPPRWTEQAIGGKGQWTNTALHANDNVTKGEGIFRVWSPAASGSIPDPLFTDSNNLESLLTNDSKAARETWDAYTFDKNCRIPGLPRVNFGPHPHQFIDQRDQIIIISEEFNVPRTVHLNSDIPPESQPLSPMGYSMGQWEDSRTLVVNTSRINFPYIDLSGAGQSEEVTITERYVLSEDETRLDYRIEVTDPIMLKQPYVISGIWLDLDEGMAIYDCQVME